MDLPERAADAHLARHRRGDRRFGTVTVHQQKPADPRRGELAKMFGIQRSPRIRTFRRWPASGGRVLVRDCGKRAFVCSCSIVQRRTEGRSLRRRRMTDRGVRAALRRYQPATEATIKHQKGSMTDGSSNRTYRLPQTLYSGRNARRNLHQDPGDASRGNPRQCRLRVRRHRRGTCALGSCEDRWSTACRARIRDRRNCARRGAERRQNTRRTR